MASLIQQLGKRKTLLVSLVALTCAIQPDAAVSGDGGFDSSAFPSSCVIEIELVKRGSPSKPMELKLAAAIHEADSATTNAEKLRTAKKLERAKADADESRSYLLCGVAVSEGSWKDGAGCVIEVPSSGRAAKLTQGVFAKVAEIRSKRIEDWWQPRGSKVEIFDSNGATALPKPKNWPDTTTVMRAWEQPNDSATRLLTLSVQRGRPRNENEQVFRPLRVTNTGTKTIIVARVQLEIYDEFGFLQYVAAMPTIKNLPAQASVEVEIPEPIADYGGSPKLVPKAALVQLAP